MMNRDLILKVLDEKIENPTCPLNYEKDYELLLAVMLSAQTTDRRVNEVTKVLFKYSLQELESMQLEKIEEIIKRVGTQKRKAKYIKDIAKILLEESDGKVPFDRDFLMKLPGVGHKTCNVVFSELFKSDAIAVDTHVSRVSKRLGLADDHDDVFVIEKKLMEYFPRNTWSKLHLQLVLFGRHYCKSKNPLCNNCPFKDKICKYKK